MCGGAPAQWKLPGMCSVLAKRLNEILGYVRVEMVNRSWERILSFYGTGETNLGIFHPVQVSAFKKGCWRVLKRATKMIEGLENWPYRGRT